MQSIIEESEYEQSSLQEFATLSKEDLEYQRRQEELSDYVRKVADW